MAKVMRALIALIVLATPAAAQDKMTYDDFYKGAATWVAHHPKSCIKGQWMQFIPCWVDNDARICEEMLGATDSDQWRKYKPWMGTVTWNSHWKWKKPGCLWLADRVYWTAQAEAAKRDSFRRRSEVAARAQ